MMLEQSYQRIDYIGNRSADDNRRNKTEYRAYDAEQEPQVFKQNKKNDTAAYCQRILYPSVL